MHGRYPGPSAEFGEAYAHTADMISETMSVVVVPSATPVSQTLFSLNPILDSTDVGHEWHRWVEGNVCYIRPRDWNIATTVDQIIDKVTDWYHNYMAVKLGLVDRMPDVGRVTL